MIPDTFPHYVFIRASIWGLRAVAPAATLYSAGRCLGYSLPLAPWPLELLAYAEVLFYLCISLPRQRALEKSVPRPAERSRQQRRELFERSWSGILDMESFLRVWFRGAPPESIRRDNFKDFLAWAFFNEKSAEACDDDELEEYVRRTEEALGRTLADGRGPCQPSRVSTDALHFQHKPLMFYLFAIAADDVMTYLAARHIGLQHFRLPLKNFFTVFPFRPQTLLTGHESPSTEISYWHRPHTSTTRLPVLFIHGIGAGMRTYTGFLRDFIRQDAADDGQTGIIAVELMTINMRITKEILPRTEMLAEILKIVDHHGWDKFVIVGHSYGTIIATHLLHHLRHTDRVGPIMLVDPVTLSIHWGGIPYNFLYRHPRKASEWQLQYFASTDMGVAHTITRRFDWAENVMWKDDMKGRAITVTLAAADIIVDTSAVLQYLSADDELDTRSYKAEDIVEAGELQGRVGLDVVWFDALNHAGVFDHPKDWAVLVKILHSYCRM